MKRVFVIIKAVLIAVIVAGSIVFVVCCVKPAASVQKRFEGFLEKDVEGGFDLSFPNGITAEYSMVSYSIDSEVDYFYCTIKGDPAGEFETSSTRKEIARDKFEKYLSEYAIKINLEEETKKQVPEKYLPKFEEKCDYYFYEFTTANRIVYLYIVYDARSNSLVVCKEITQYAHE